MEGKHQCPARQQLRRRHVHLNTPVRVKSSNYTPLRVSSPETHTSSSQQTAHSGGRKASMSQTPAAPPSPYPPKYTPVRVSSPKTHTTSSQQSGHAHPIASAVRKHTPFRVSISETHTSSSQQTAHPGGRELSAFRKPAAPQSQCPPQQTAVRVSTSKTHTTSSQQPENTHLFKSANRSSGCKGSINVPNASSSAVAISS